MAVIAFGCSAKGKRDRLQARAESYFTSGEYDKAKIEYLNLLRAEPTNAMAIERLGLVWFEQGAPLRALQFLPAARDLQPDNLNVRTKLASAYAAVGHAAKARTEAMAILAKIPDHDEAMILLAETSRSPEEIEYTEQQLREGAQLDKASRHLATAALFLRKGQTDGAVVEVERALALDPKSPLAHVAKANIRWAKSDLAGAEEAFKAAAGFAPLRSPARMKYAEFKMNTRAVDEAQTLLTEITDLAPDYLPAWNVRAQIASAGKKYDEALAFIANVLVRDDQNIDARMLQVGVWMARGDVEKAERALDTLNQQHPNMALIKYQLARAYLRSNKTDKAALELNEVVAANPDFMDAQMLLASINLRRGDAEAVVGAMEELLKKHPTVVQPQLLLVEAYRSLSRLDDAVVVLREQIATSPQSATAYFLLGFVLNQKKQTDEALAAYEKALALAPENFLILLQIIDLDIGGKRFAEAAKRVQTAMEKTPGSAGHHFLEGKIFGAQGDWDHAETALLKTLKLDADFPNAADSLISVYVAAKKLPQALSVAESVLAKSPNTVNALKAAALIYEEMNEFGKARDAYEKLLSVTPGDAPFMNQLAYLYSERLNQLDRAYDLARKARELQPSDPGTADTLGWILYKRGDYPQALALIRESAPKLAAYPEVQYHLGMASYAMGQRESARTAFQNAARSPADFPGKVDIGHRLAMLDNTGELSADLSLEVLETMVKQNADDTHLRVRLGEAYERQGEFAKAEGAYEQAHKLNPKLLAPALKLAQLNAGPLQKKDKAIEFAKKARELAPNDPVVIGSLGSLAYRTGNFVWAYSLLQQSARQGAVRAETLHDFAWSAFSLGKLDEARRVMQRMLTEAPDSPHSEDAKVFLAMTEPNQNAEKLAEREVEAEKLLKVDPQYTPALMVRAAIQVQRGESKAAATIYTEVLRRFPDFAPAQMRLAALYFEEPNNLAKAYDLAMKARQTLPQDPDLAQTLGEISYARREFAYALQLLQESAGKRPLDAKGLYYLGMARFQAKAKPLSREALEQALAAGLQEPLATSAKQTIKELQQE